MTDTTTDTRPTYGNWITHRSPGLFGAGLIGTGVLFAGVVGALFAMLLAGLVPALVVAGAAVVAFTAVGTPVGRWVARRVQYTHSYLRREHQFRSGMFSRGRAPHNRLPGMLGSTSLVGAFDSFGSPFVVVKNPAGLFTMVARCSAEGPWMQDRDRIDSWVAGYSTVLAACGQETGLVCAKAITDTAPDPGGRLEAMVHSLRSPTGPQLARQVMDECVTDLPAASSENITYLELTFKGRAINRKNDEQAVVAELARKVPAVIARMQMAGGGSVEMVTPDELPRIVRVGYDPASQPGLEQAEINGEHNVVAWTDAGPVAYQDLWGDFVHDSGHSISWEMYGAPKSKITELALSGLLAPHSDFARKRVALVYRPHTPTSPPGWPSGTRTPRTSSPNSRRNGPRPARRW